MKTVNRINGYKFSNNGNGKKWIRGRIMFSEGKKYEGRDIIPIIAKTNMNTGEISEANEKEKKRFIIE